VHTVHAGLIVKWKYIQQQGGFIASYILYGIGLLAIVGAAYGRLNAGTQQVELVQKTVEEIAVQLEILKGKIMLCAAVYPDGDHAQFNARHAYPAPATPDNQQVVSLVTCPASGAGLSLTQMPDGVALPVSPPDFNEWVYEHTLANGIRLRLVPRVSDGAAAVRTRLLRQYAGSVTAQGDQLVFEILR
jgi:hypothetical protein